MFNLLHSLLPCLPFPVEMFPNVFVTLPTSTANILLFDDISYFSSYFAGLSFLQCLSHVLGMVGDLWNLLLMLFFDVSPLPLYSYLATDLKQVFGDIMIDYSYVECSSASMTALAGVMLFREDEKSCASR